jgi:hypothetical protein
MSHLTTREKQIKFAMKSLFTPDGMAIIKKTKAINILDRMWIN